MTRSPRIGSTNSNQGAPRRDTVLRRRKPTRVHQPGVQSLEGRLLLSFSPTGPEIQVNATPATIAGATTPDVAVASNGDYAVVWSKAVSSTVSDIMLRRFSANGTAKTTTDVNLTSSTYLNTEPHIAMAPDGRFVVTWTGGTSRGDSDIFANLYSAAGVQQGSTITVPTTNVTTRNQIDSDVAMSDDGSFGVVWTSVFTSSDNDLYYRAFSSTGTPLNPDSPVAVTSGDELDASISRRPGSGSSGFYQVISWTENLSDNYDIAYQPFSSAINRSGSKQFANSVTAGDQTQSTVGMNSQGGFTIAWTTPGTSDTDISLRQFNSAGTALTTADVPVVTQTGAQSRPSLAVSANGNYVIGYQDGSDNSVRYREGFYAGNLGPITRYETTATANVVNPQLAINPSGKRLLIVGDNSRIQAYDPFVRSYRKLATTSDFDGDGKTDTAVYGYGRLAYRPSGGGTDVTVSFGGPNDVAVSGDFDGDGQADVAVYGYGRLAYRPSSGGNDVYVTFGGPSDVFVSGDFDGDGKSDVAVYGYGRLAYISSANGNTVTTTWGGPNDVFVSGDFDGDGKTDVTVYGYGRFASIPSSGGNAVFTPYGGPNDIPVTGDFDGDGKTDIAVYGYGRFATIRSTTGQQFTLTFGGTADIPLIGEYDGFGITNFSVYGYGRLAVFSQLTMTTRTVTFGGPSDTPLPKTR